MTPVAACPPTAAAGLDVPTAESKPKFSKATPFGVPKATMIPVEINEQHDQQAIFCKANAGALVTPDPVGQQNMLGKTAAGNVTPSALLLSPNANNPKTPSVFVNDVQGQEPPLHNMQIHLTENRHAAQTRTTPDYSHNTV